MVTSSRTHCQEGLGKPFGYLKAASTGGVVNLVVLPYDYSDLATLVDTMPKVGLHLSPVRVLLSFRAVIQFLLLLLLLLLSI